MARWVPTAVAVAAAALGLASIIAGLAVAILGFAPVPFSDSLSFLHKFFETGGWSGYGLADLYRRHNEHRIVLPSLWFLADLRFFAGTQAFLVAVSVVSSLAHAAVLAWLFRRLGHGGAAAAALAAIAAGAALSPAQWENLVWGFQVQFVQVWLLATLALAALAAGKDRDRWWRPAAAVACGLAATYTMANGLLIWPLLVGLALWRGLRGGRLWTLVTVGAAVTAIEVAGFRPHPTHGDPVAAAMQPFAVARYALRYLTSGVAAIGPTARDLLGAALVLALLAATVDAVRRRDRYRPEHGVLLAAAGFVVGAALLTALGRVGFGLEQADASRYATPSLVFLTILMALALDGILRSKRPAAAPAVIAGGALLVLVPGLTVAYRDLPSIAGSRDSRVGAIVEHIAGGYRPAAMLSLYPRLQPRANRVVERLDRDDLGPFALRARFMPPREVLRGPVASPSEPCRGFVDGAVSDPVVGVEVWGWATQGDGDSQPRWVLVADADGAIVAWGASLVWRPDVASALGTRWGGRGFKATGRQHSAGPLTAIGVFDDGTRCRIGAAITPAPPRFLAGLPDAARPAGRNWIVAEGADSADGQRTGIPAAVEPAVGIDGLPVSPLAAFLDLEAPEDPADLLVPVRTGAYPIGAQVVLVDPATGAELDRHDFGRPSADGWTWLVLRGAGAATGRPLRLRAVATGEGRWQGLAVGRPYWLPVKARG